MKENDYDPGLDPYNDGEEPISRTESVLMLILLFLLCGGAAVIDRIQKFSVWFGTSLLERAKKK